MLKDLRHHLLDVEKEVNLLRQRIDDSTVVITKKESNAMEEVQAPTATVTVLSDGEWDFEETRRGSSSQDVKLLTDALKMMTKTGDKIRLGPFESPEKTRSIQSQIGNVVYGILKWPRQSNGSAQGLAPYESHIKPSQPLYLYIRRNYAG